MKVIYVGKNTPGSSMHLVAQQIVDNAGGVLMTGLGEQMKGMDVVSLVPEDTPKLLTARRFMGVGAITLFLAGNWEDCTDWDRGALLSFVQGNKLVVHSKILPGCGYQYSKKYAVSILSAECYEEHNLHPLWGWA